MSTEAFEVQVGSQSRFIAGSQESAASTSTQLWIFMVAEAIWALQHSSQHSCEINTFRREKRDLSTVVQKQGAIPCIITPIYT